MVINRIIDNASVAIASLNRRPNCIIKRDGIKTFKKNGLLYLELIVN